MTDLDAAIRRELDQFCESDMCAEKGKAAILAVLDLHRPREDDRFQIPMLNKTVRRPCKQCSSLGTGGMLVAVYYPCPTLLAIAEALGIEP